MVPNVVGKSEAEARAELEAAGFTVSVNKPLGFVVFGVNSQNPRRGHQGAQGLDRDHHRCLARTGPATTTRWPPWPWSGSRPCGARPSWSSRTPSSRCPSCRSCSGGSRIAAAGAGACCARARVRALTPEKRRHGVYLGLLLGGGYVLQTFGLLHTSATVSGFITGMFVVFTPLIGWAVLAPADRTGGLGRRRRWPRVGLALISLNGFAIGFGELLTLGCAALFAGQIVGLGPLVHRRRTPTDSRSCSSASWPLMCLVASPLQGGLVLPPDAGVWAAIAVPGPGRHRPGVPGPDLGPDLHERPTRRDRPDPRAGVRRHLRGHRRAATR